MMTTPQDFQPVLDEINAEIRPLLGVGGKFASYIPALARVPASQFGIALRTCSGHEACAGDAAVPFSIQSVSKLFTLTLACSTWANGHRPPGKPVRFTGGCRTRP
ncbi:glutaminase [Variovorax sp. J22R133]|uniref:glutaminase n=1 Tax=Variovorax brevis TaxID=3053503 RepID=UPI00257822EE|nr:glutaminase [Variovorax sp. J22R133]MDM0116829.1 glutaminase [Variovorax sp. J22R133]